jgi:copper chaperone CopZ
MAANHITVKGNAVDPDALCQRLRSKTKREVTVISPLPPPPAPPADEAAPPPPPPAEDPVRTVELEVNMHCDACAEQLQKKMLKMKGVQTAETDLAAGKLTVTGTVEGETIVEYIHRRTGKLATVVPPPPPPEAPKEEAAPPAEAEQKPAEDGKKEEDEKKAAAEAEQAAGEEKKEAADASDEKPVKQEGEERVAVDGFPPEEMMKRMVYWPYGGAHYSYKLQPADAEEAMMARRMAMHTMPPPPPPPHHHHPYAMMHQHHQWMPPPPPPPPAPMYYGSSYMMERPPQMFSDENPNACVIS